MKGINKITAAISAVLMLSACQQTEAKQLFMAGGHLTACSSMTQSDCQDWATVRSTTFQHLTDDEIRTPQAEQISVSNEYVTRVLNTAAWANEPQWQQALNNTLLALQQQEPDFTFDSWDNFKSAFIAVDATTVDTSINGVSVSVDGDYLWYNSSSDQWDALHFLKVDDGLVHYTTSAAKIDQAKASFAEHLALVENLNALQQDRTYSYIELVNTLSSPFSLLSIEDQYRLLRTLRDDINYQRPIERVSLEDTNNADAIAAYKKFVELAASNATDGSKPRVLVMTSSSNNNYDVADFYVDVFTQAGAEALWLPIDRAYRQAADNGQCEYLQLYHDVFAGKPHQDLYFPDYAAMKQQACEAPSTLLTLINSADAVFINGGSQRRTLESLITDTIDSEEMALIRTRYEQGELLVGGSSAGTAVLTGGRLTPDSAINPMVDGGTNYDVLVGGYPSGAYMPTGGLGLFTLGVSDTHFSERARETRLIKLIEQQGTRFGFGVDETTALIVQQSSVGGNEKVDMSVVGSGGVFIVDMQDSSVTSSVPLWVNDVTTHFLREGDKLTFDTQSQTYSITFSEGSTVVAPKSSGRVLTNNDILYTERDNYRSLVNDMVTSRVRKAEGRSYENNPTYYVTLSRTEDTETVVDASHNASYRAISVDITHD